MSNRTAEHCISQFAKEWQAEADSIRALNRALVEQGRWLLALKDAIQRQKPAGSWEETKKDLCKRFHRLSTRKIEYLTHIAGNPILTDPQNFADTPVGYSKQNDLAQLPPAKLQRLYDDKVIHAEMTGREVKQLVDAQLGKRTEPDGAADELDARKILTDYFKLKRAHPDPSKLKRFELLPHIREAALEEDDWDARLRAQLAEWERADRKSVKRIRAVRGEASLCLTQ